MKKELVKVAHSKNEVKEPVQAEINIGMIGHVDQGK